MNSKRAKRARSLAHHVEYGGNYPAMHQSGLELVAMRLTPKQMRRADALALRKINKTMEQGRREDIGIAALWLEHPDLTYVQVLKLFYDGQ